METLRYYEAGEEGTPQGAVISPLLANIYLNPLDHEMAEKGYEMVRYADDFVVLCQDRETAERALGNIQKWVEQAGLTLHPEKTKIVDASQRGGFDFLGYHFERGRKWPRKKSVQKVCDTVRGLTPRSSGQAMGKIIKSLNAVLRGWFGYFKHGAATTMIEVDQRVRQRLRGILRRREKRYGCVSHLDRRRYPNTYFAGLGLFSLKQARDAVVQSHRTSH
jgi:RNA-directed DNA polymerase